MQTIQKVVLSGEQLLFLLFSSIQGSKDINIDDDTISVVLRVYDRLVDMRVSPEVSIHPVL